MRFVLRDTNTTQRKNKKIPEGAIKILMKVILIKKLEKYLCYCTLMPRPLFVQLNPISELSCSVFCFNLQYQAFYGFSQNLGKFLTLQEILPAIALKAYKNLKRQKKFIYEKCSKIYL